MIFYIWIMGFFLLRYLLLIINNPWYRLMNLIMFDIHVCIMVENDDSSSPDISKIVDASKVSVEE